MSTALSSRKSKYSINDMEKFNTYNKF
jgi:hypothetical protein